jgi:serine/threonine protein kinase
LLDRLYDTLEKRIKTWKREVDELTGIRAHLSRRDPGGAKKVKLYEQRVTVAYDLSSALAYIHRNRIIHRDLKPDNMGFDIRGAIKVCCAADMGGNCTSHR